MSPIGTEAKQSPLKLLPHQTALLEAFFNPASKRVILLRGEVGLGKTTTLVALASRLLQERPTARALFLIPAALRLQFVAMLRDRGTPAFLVDRYKFREMLDSAAGGEFWPRGVVAVLSLDFAKKPDIRDSLAETRWDLVIADEAHSFSGVRAEEALRQLGASAERVVLATRPDLESPDVFPPEDTTVVEWRRDQVIDHDGRPLDAVPRPVLHEVPFSLSQAELNLLETVHALCQIVEAGTPRQTWVANSLLRSLQSSPAVLEAALQRFAAGSEEQGDTDALLEVLEEDMAEERPAWLIDRATTEKVGAIARRALQEIEAITRDSKLGAFGELLTHLSEAKTPCRRICVLTEYLATLYYLAAEIESCGLACQLLYGGMGAENQQRVLALFLNEGGVLVATKAVMTVGINLREVTGLVLYDLPGDKVALQEVLSRFDRFGRVSQLNVHVLSSPFASAGGLISEPLRLLREILGFPARAEPAR